jgi:hypothetical protein
MIYTAEQKDKQNQCWMVRRQPETDSERKEVETRTEAELWGAASEQEAIEMAKARESWA